MSVFSARFLIAIVVLAILAAGCDGWSVGRDAPGTSTPISSARSPSTRAAVVAVALNLQNSYRRSDWSAIRGEFTDARLASTLVSTMQEWHRAHVRNLHVSVVYTRRLASGDYIETLQFWEDPRAVPDFTIYLIRPGPPARIVGTASGITGTSFRNATWTVTRSAHFIFYHSPYQLEGSDRHFIADLEYERTQFILKFGVKLPPVAAYYLYPTQDLMSALTRHTAEACGLQPENVGCANPFSTPPAIQSVLWPTYHEPIHVYQLALEPKPPSRTYVLVAPLFIAEGTAVALEDREVDPRLSDYCSALDLVYVPLDECGRIAARHVKQPINLLPDAGFERSNLIYAYSLGGSFVKYLILKYGYRPFGRFYYALAAQPQDRVSDYNVASEAVYHLTIQRLLQQFMASLCSSGC